MACHQARLAAPFSTLGIRVDGGCLISIDYLAIETPPLVPENSLAREICTQLEAYLADPHFVFDLPLRIEGTNHQRRVWEAIANIASGNTLSYAEIAATLHSAPRAVGQACGANPIPIVIPCHRVIAKDGGLGGFMNAREGTPLKIKRWLLHHERLARV